MAESKIKFKKCSLLPNEGSGLDEEYNVLAGAPLLNYYESITTRLHIARIHILKY